MDQTRWLDANEQQLWRAWIRAHTRMVTRLDFELQAAHGVSFADYEVLVNLSEAPERSLRMAELAERLRLSPSGLTRRLDGLVRDGMVERRKCPSDGRGSLARLTDEGMACLEAAAPTHVAGVRRYFVDPLTGAQQAGLAESLQVIEAELVRPAPDGTPCPEESVTASTVPDQPQSR